MSASGNPALLAGESITLGMAGMPFDGYYICSAARHVFDPDNGGYTTWVTVGGLRDRSLFALSLRLRVRRTRSGPPYRDW